MGVVTYKGPTDKADPSNRYRVPVVDGPDLVFRLDVPVSDVPAGVVDQLKGVEGHAFEVGSAAKRAKADVQAEARSLDVEFNDRTTVDELEDAIAKAKADAEGGAE